MTPLHDDADVLEAQQNTLPPPYVPPSPLQSAPQQPLRLHSLEWFDANIAANERIALERLRLYHEAMGAVEILRLQRDLLLSQPGNGNGQP